MDSYDSSPSPPPPPPEPLPSEWRFSIRKVMTEAAFLAAVLTVFRLLQRLVRPDAGGGGWALAAIGLALGLIYLIEVWEDFDLPQKAVIRFVILAPTILAALALLR